MSCLSLIPVLVFVARPYLQIEEILAKTVNPVSGLREQVKILFSDRRPFTNQLWFMVENHAGFTYTANREDLTSISLLVSTKEVTE